jgi:ubiquinone/menaquinone biosynthesis C-methylase UbiE
MPENAFEKNTTIWERIYSGGEAGSFLNYPCEDLVVVSSRYFSGLGPGKEKLLDIGFGSGNNLLFFADRGFECSGVDVSQTAIEIASKRLSQKGLSADLRAVIGDNTLPFDDDSFDVVVAWHVLSYNDLPGLAKMLSEIRRILKPGGIFIASFPTYREYRVAKAKHISGNIFEHNSDKSNQKGAIIVAAETEDDIRRIFSEFTSIEIGYSEITMKGITNSHWMIAAR